MNRSALGLHWDLEPGLTFLNHGSFGLAPRELLQWRFGLLQEMERDPVAFLVEQLPPRLEASRASLADLVGAHSQQLAFVPSTTFGLNQLLQRLDPNVDRLPAGSEILIADQGYNATRNLAAYAAKQRGWTLRIVRLPLPLQDPAHVVQAFAEAWSVSTRLLLVDHITSPTATVLPLAQLVELARHRQALVIVDGAHAPGSLSLDLNALQPDAYVGNLHKWLCCPRGAAFLWVREPWQERLRPLVISHGANAPLSNGTSRFHQEHDWLGTFDPSPWLALPQVLALFQQNSSQEPPARSLERMMLTHRELAQQGQACLLQALGVHAIAPSTQQVAMAAVPLPPVGLLDGPALQRLLRQQGVQVPVIPLQPYTVGAPQFLRISCFAYNTLSDVEKLANLLPAAVAATAA